MHLVKTAFGPVEYSTIGRGIAVLVLHGGHSNCRDTLCCTGFDLSKYCLIIPSRPGYGKTPLGLNSQPKDAAFLMIELLNKLAVDKAIVLGISAGGLTAICLAAEFGNRTEKLILISAVTRKWLSKKSREYQLARVLFAPKVEKVTWYLFKFFFTILPNTMSRIFINQLSLRPPKGVTIRQINTIRKLIMSQASGKGFIADINQRIEVDNLAQINCPTLILHSRFDKAVPIEFAHFANERISNAKLRIYQNACGHMLWLDRDSQLRDDVNTFLSN